MIKPPFLFDQSVLGTILIHIKSTKNQPYGRKSGP